MAIPQHIRVFILYLAGSQHPLSPESGSDSSKQESAYQGPVRNVLSLQGAQWKLNAAQLGAVRQESHQGYAPRFRAGSIQKPPHTPSRSDKVMSHGDWMHARLLLKRSVPRGP